jgi:hypothetical protein
MLIRSQSMNTNEAPLPAASPRAAARTPLPRAPRRPVDPERLKQLICNEGNSLTHAAQMFGVCTNTVSVAAVRLGIPIDARPKKIDQALNRQVSAALERNLPLARIVAETGVSLTSLYRFLRMYPQQAYAYRLRMLEQERLDKRQRFTLQVVGTPMTRCADYYWLRRNDAEWIAQFVAGHAPRPGATHPGRRPS